MSKVGVAAVCRRAHLRARRAALLRCAALPAADPVSMLPAGAQGHDVLPGAAAHRHAAQAADGGHLLAAGRRGAPRVLGGVGDGGRRPHHLYTVAPLPLRPLFPPVTLLQCFVLSLRYLNPSSPNGLRPEHTPTDIPERRTAPRPVLPHFHFCRHLNLGAFPSQDKALSCPRRFTKSVIKSRAALTYAEAQSRIDDTRLHDEANLFAAATTCCSARPCQTAASLVLGALTILLQR